MINNQKGYVVSITTFFVLILMTSIAISMSSLIVYRQKISTNAVKSTQSYYAAESGIEDAVYRIRNKKQYSANYNLTVGQSTITVNISDTNANTKTITSQSNLNNIFRNVQAVLNTTTVNPQFYYGAQAGEGGVVMGENSKIQGSGGTVGNLYSNGPVTGDNGATITGGVTVATGISLDSQNTVCNTDQIVGKTNPQIDFAQSFIASQSKPLAKISLYLKKSGNPDNRTIKITGNSSITSNSYAPAPFVSPDKDNVLASATLDSNLVTTNYGWIDIVFSSPPNLIDTNIYWIVLDADQKTNKYWLWCKDNNSSGISQYKQDWSESGFWTQSQGDFNFKVYLGTGISILDNVVVYGTAKANSITNSKICGNGYYQSIDSSSSNFLNAPTNPTCSNPLTPGIGYSGQPDPPVSPLPISDANIAQWKTDAKAGGTISGDYNLTSNASLGPKEITGNLNITSSNKTLTVTGTIYVQGNIDINNGSTTKCDPSFGVNSCLILADGWIHLSNNSQFQGSGTSGSYIMLLSTLQCDGSSSTSPDEKNCGHHNGAIDLHNNATGAVFYASKGLAKLHNGVNVTELIAHKINLDNNAIVSYEQGLSNSQFSSGPGGSWKITSWVEK